MLLNPQQPAANTAPLTGFGLRPLVYVVGMWRWKEPSFAPFLTDADGNCPDILYFDETFGLDRIEDAVMRERPTEIIIWGMKEPAGLTELATKNNIPTRRVEDGFLRSVNLTSARHAPLSLCFDSRGMYFDPRQPSDLIHLLTNEDPAADTGLMARAEAGMTRLIHMGISKYNHAAPVDIEAVYGAKTKPRVLVLGQVEDDQSIEFGYPGHFENNDLVRLASSENPDAQIIYKPHPDVLAKDRPAVSDPNAVRDIALVVDQPLSLADALETIDHVYTATSLGGFEALLRGIKVTTLGQPFYAGWGLTDDRNPPSDQRPKRSLAALFAAAYLLYPEYRHPETGAVIRFEDAIDYLAEQRRRQH